MDRKASLPPDEAGRLKALQRYEILDTDSEAEFDDITLLASHICGTPIAMISLVDENRQWFKSKVGITENETSRDIAFCAHGILQNDMFIVEDAQADKRFASNPLVTGNPKIRFYAGSPLITQDGHALGMLCVNDRVPRELSAEQKAALRALSRQVVTQLELRHAVSQLKRSETALRESEERFREMAENIDEVVWMSDPETTRILYINPAYEKIWGRTCQSLYDRPLSFMDSVHPDDRKGIIEGMETQAVDGLFHYEYRIFRPDGSLRWISARSFPIRNNAGEFVRVVGIAQDITERKQLEQHLKMQTDVRLTLAEVSNPKEAILKVLRIVCETLGWDVGALWSVDQREGVLRCEEIWSAPNVQAGEFIEASRRTTFKAGAGLPGRVWASGEAAWIADVPNDPNFPRGPFAKKAGLRGACGFPILCGRGVSYVLEFFSHELRQPDDDLLQKFSNIGSQLGQFFERKRVDEHLIQSQKMETVGKLAGGVAHEFNSIMTAIIGQSELLLEDLEEGSPFRKNAQAIRQAADRAAALTRQLLAYGRKQILQPAILDLNSLVADMEVMLRQLAGGDVDVRIAPTAGLKPVKADAGQIEHVIMNIVMNAADAMPNGGKLTLETANISLDEEYVRRFPDLKAGEYVMLAIADTGAGMSEEIKARLFEPFFPTKGVGKGTGLGLATCHGIIKQSGGHISVYSEMGRGTTFKVFLPRVTTTPSEPGAAPAPLLKEPPIRGTETVLLVEDDASLRDLAATVLERLGYTVYAAANGSEAMSIAQRTADLDLLLTDVVMPQMSGKELADQLRSSQPAVKVLFTSAYTEEAIVHHGILDPGIDFLHKPYTPALLSRKAREALDGTQTQRR